LSLSDIFQTIHSYKLFLATEEVLYKNLWTIEWMNEQIGLTSFICVTTWHVVGTVNVPNERGILSAYWPLSALTLMGG